MSKISDVFGDDFAEEYSEKEQEREERKRKIDKEDLMQACWHAVNGDGFDGEEPRFTYDAGEVEYDVLLMQAPENNMQKFIHDLPDSFGASGKSFGMFHLGELFSCSFIEDMADLIGKVEEGEHYIVVGTYQENQSNGETYYNISPVAGISPISQAKKYADKVDEKMQGSSIEQQAQEQSVSEDDSDDDISLNDDDTDDDVKASEEDVMKVFKAVSNKKEEVMRSVSSGDEEALTKLTSLVDSNTDGDVDEEYVADIFEDNIESIDGRGEEEEDDMDLGLDDGDDMDLGDEDTDDEDDDDEVIDETTDEDGGEDEDEEGVEDWF